MKRVRFHELGGPEVLRLEEDEDAPPTTGEVLLEIQAIGLNRGEAAFRGGHYLVKPALPSLIGAEATGRIKALGDDVSGWEVGDQVAVLPLFPPGRYGVYATEAVVPASALVRIPDGMDPAVSAAVWVAFLTAWGALVDTAQLRAGQHVILTAASSSVGVAALQIARDVGARPVAVTRKLSKAKALFDFGAEHVVATESDDIVEASRKITDGKGAPLIFDAVAGPFAETLMSCLAEHGTLMIYGGLSNQPTVFPRHLAIRGNLGMRGYSFVEMLGHPHRREAGMQYIAERLADGRFKMPIARTFRLEEIVEAHRFLESNEQVGKVVMVPR